MNNIAEELRDIADKAEAGDKLHLAKAMRACALQLDNWQRDIGRLRAIEAAARNLCEVKGRHHSEIAMRRLIEALTPNVQADRPAAPIAAGPATEGSEVERRVGGAES